LQVPEGRTVHVYVYISTYTVLRGQTKVWHALVYRTI